MDEHPNKNQTVRKQFSTFHLTTTYLVLNSTLIKLSRVFTVVSLNRITLFFRRRGYFISYYLILKEEYLSSSIPRESKLRDLKSTAYFKSSFKYTPTEETSKTLASISEGKSAKQYTLFTLNSFSKDFNSNTRHDLFTIFKLVSYRPMNSNRALIFILQLIQSVLEIKT